MQAGDKIEYQVGNQWKKGTIHGVKKAEAVKGPDIVLSYLVDTGKDARIDKVVHDVRDDAVTDMANKIVADPKDHIDNFVDAVAKAEKSNKLPESKLVTETIRQPEQIEVLPENIRAVK